MAIIGPYSLSGFSFSQIPLQYITDHGIDKVLTVQGGGFGPRQTVRINTSSLLSV